MFEFRLKFQLKFVPKGSIDNNPALFQIMAWRGPVDKPLSEPMMVSSLTHICVTRPQWVNLLGSDDIATAKQTTTKLFAYSMEHTEYNAAHYWQITEETKKNLFLDLINYGIGEPLTREGCMGFLPDT